MKTTCDTSTTTAPWRPRSNWLARFIAPGGVKPSLVLDFEAGKYGTPQVQAPLSSWMTFTRASTATGKDALGATVVYPLDMPVFDWSAGYRQLVLASASGPRAADSAQVALGPWWTPATSTLVVHGTLLGTSGTFDRVSEFHSGSSSDRLSLFYSLSTGRLAAAVVRAGTTEAGLNSSATALAIGSPFRVAVAHKAADFGMSLNGGPVVGQASGLMPTGLTTLELSAGSGGSNHLSVALRSVAIYPVRLGNAALTQMSGLAP